MEYPFIIGKQYTRKDIFSIIGVPENTKGGPWFTGYHIHNGDVFIFANVGVPGRTGHNYENQFIGDELSWYGKTNSSEGQPTIQTMLHGPGNVYVFTRSDDRLPFSYEGKGKGRLVSGTVPVQVIWSFSDDASFNPIRSVEELVQPGNLKEGAKKTIVVNAYERNPLARRLCIEHYGPTCVICTFSFKDKYGVVGEGFIHVHHVKPLHEVAQEYDVDPIEDLRPVCPNCHAIIHKRIPAYSIDEVKGMLK